MSSPPSPPVTSALVSLTDTWGGNMMQRGYALRTLKTLFVVFFWFCGTFDTVQNVFFCFFMRSPFAGNKESLVFNFI